MSCFVTGCTTGYRSEKFSNRKAGKKDYTLFSARTEEIAKSWGSVIPRKDKIFKKGDKVCELHFAESFIERDYVTVMPDGTVVRIPKGKQTLKPNAIPSIFTQEEIKALRREKFDIDIRPQLIIEKPTLKEEEKIESVEAQKPIAEPAVVWLPTKEEDAWVSESESLLDYRCQDLEDSASNVSTLSNASAKSDLDFRDLMKELEGQSPHATILKFYQSIKTPSPLWLPCVTQGCAMWCLWKNDLSSCDRRVVISPDMSVRIFVNEKELPVAGMDKVGDIEDVPDVLETVSRILPCPSVEDGKEAREDCVGYVFGKRKGQPGFQRSRCDPCYQKRRALMKNFKRKTLKLKRKLPLMKQKDKEADLKYKEA